MCCIVGGAVEMLMGLGLSMCSDALRLCCVRLLLRNGLMPPILHIEGSEAGKEG